MTVPKYELKDKWIEPEKLLLWPNNPRLKISTFDDMSFSSEELCSKEVQEKLTKLMLKEEHDVKEIIDSIASQGYTNLNPIIVKQVEGTDKYIVLEGNRRTTALHHWLGNISDLSDEITETLQKVQAKEFITDSNDDYLEIFQLLAQMHIAGKKDWTALQQAHMISQTYDGLCKLENLSEAFEYCPRLTKECAKILGEKWTEIKKDLAIFRIYKQLQTNQFMVEHSHYTKIRLYVESSKDFEGYISLNPDNFKIDKIGLERLFDLCLNENCAVANPQDFRKLKFIFKHGGEKELETLREAPELLESINQRYKNSTAVDPIIHSLAQSLKALNQIKPSMVKGSEDEEKEIRKILERGEGLLKLVKSCLPESKSEDSFDNTQQEKSNEQEIRSEDYIEDFGFEEEGMDLEVEERLTEKDLIDPRYLPDTFYYKDYTLEASNFDDGTPLQIDLLSDEFDAFLYLFRGQEEEHFISDDNGGEGKNARIKFNFDSSTNYTIRVTSAEPHETGKFTLMIE